MAITPTLNLYLNYNSPNQPVLISPASLALARGVQVVGGEKVTLKVHLVNATGSSPTYALPASGDTIRFTAKKQASDEELVYIFDDWTISGDHVACTADFATVEGFWASASEVAKSLIANFEVETESGLIRKWSFFTQVVRQSYGGESPPVNPGETYVKYTEQAPTAPQQSQALANLGGTTVGKAVFSLTNPSAVTWLRVNADNSVTALSAADTRAALGAGTGSGDLLNSGTITLVNAGKVAVITAANTLGAGVGYTSATTASTIVSRDSAGQFKGGNTDIEARVGPSASGPNASYAFGVFDALDSILMGGFRFVGFTANDLESVAYKSISAQFKAWNSDGATFRTANGTEAGTFGAANSTGWNFPGDALWTSGASSTYVSGTGLILNDGTNDTITLDTASGLISSTSNTIFLNGKTITAPATSGTLATLAGTETLANKRIPPRITTITSSATPTVNTDNCDMVTITALAAAITSMTTNLSGTPNNGEMLLFRIKDDGTARSITWGASFEAMGSSLPTTTVLSKILHVLFIWNSVNSKWGCLSTAQE